jgi:hypothetical protein
MTREGSYAHRRKQLVVDDREAVLKAALRPLQLRVPLGVENLLENVEEKVERVLVQHADARELLHREVDGRAVSGNRRVHVADLFHLCHRF